MSPSSWKFLAGFSPSWKEPGFHPITLLTLASKLLLLLLTRYTNHSPYLGRKPYATTHNELSWTRVTHLCQRLRSVVEFSLPDFLRKWGLHAHISCPCLCLLIAFVSTGPCNKTCQKDGTPLPAWRWSIMGKIVEKAGFWGMLSGKIISPQHVWATRSFSLSYIELNYSRVYVIIYNRSYLILRHFSTSGLLVFWVGLFKVLNSLHKLQEHSLFKRPKGNIIWQIYAI